MRGSDLANGSVASLIENWGVQEKSLSIEESRATNNAAWNDFGSRVDARSGQPISRSRRVEQLNKASLEPQLLQQQLLGSGFSNAADIYGPVPREQTLLDANPLKKLFPSPGVKVVVPTQKFSIEQGTGISMFGMACDMDGTLVRVSGENIFSFGEGEGGDGSGGGGSSDSEFEIPEVAWPIIVAGTFDSLDNFQPTIQSSFRVVDEHGLFTESMLPAVDLSLPGTHWVHIVEQTWLAQDHWSFSETLVMTFNLTGQSNAGDGETVSITRNGFVKLHFIASRVFQTSSSLGPKWTVDSDFKDAVNIDYNVSGGTTISPGSNNQPPSVVRTGADAGLPIDTDSDGTPDEFPSDYDGVSNWSASAGLLASVSGEFDVSSIPVSAPESPTSCIRNVASSGNLDLNLDVELSGNWSSNSSSGNLGVGTNANSTLSPPSSFTGGSETDGVDDLDSMTGTGHESSARGSFLTTLGRDSALDWDLNGVKHDASILDIMGDVQSKLKDNLGDELLDKRYFAWRDAGTTPSGIQWEAMITFGWNLTPEVSAKLDADESLELYVDADGDINADESQPAMVKRVANMEYDDYDFLNLKIKGNKTVVDNSNPTGEITKTWKGEVVIAYGLLTNGDGLVDIGKAIIDASVGGHSDMEWSYDGFDLVRVKINTTEKGTLDDQGTNEYGWYRHNTVIDNWHNLKDSLLIKFNGDGELHTQPQSAGTVTLSGTGKNKLVKNGGLS